VSEHLVLHLLNGLSGSIVHSSLFTRLVFHLCSQDFGVLVVLHKDVSEADEEEFRDGLASSSSSLDIRPVVKHGLDVPEFRSSSHGSGHELSLSEVVDDVFDVHALASAHEGIVRVSLHGVTRDNFVFVVGFNQTNIEIGTTQVLGTGCERHSSELVRASVSQNKIIVVFISAFPVDSDLSSYHTSGESINDHEGVVGLDVLVHVLVHVETSFSDVGDISNTRPDMPKVFEDIGGTDSEHSDEELTIVPGFHILGCPGSCLEFLVDGSSFEHRADEFSSILEDVGR